ncbi:Putative Homeobox-domain-containing protein [Rhizopus microsporus]|nr:Putative Homeobox-domain-containing protein [Rhizopus microsporus]
MSTMNNSVCQESSFYVLPTIDKGSNFACKVREQQQSKQQQENQFKTSFYNPFEIKRRKRTTRSQFKVLEKTFLDNPKPNASMRKLLAQQLDMTPRGVQVWFQNRRAKEKTVKNTREPSVEAVYYDDHYSSCPMIRTMSYPPFDGSTADEEELLLTPVTPIVDMTHIQQPVFDSTLYNSNYQWDLSEKIPQHVSYFTQQMYPSVMFRYTAPRLFDPIFDQQMTFMNPYDSLGRRNTL